MVRKRGATTQSENDGTSTKQSVEALYDYTASPDIPFLPDPRMELSMKRGDVFQLIHRRDEDGWCLVITTPTPSGEGAIEGWVSHCVP